MSIYLDIDLRFTKSRWLANLERMTSNSLSLSRRRFLGATAASAAVSMVPRAVMAGAAPSGSGRRMNVAYVGCGSQGLRQLMPALQRSELQIIAVCDPNRRSDDYPEWGRHELNNKVREFLADPAWANGARGGLCGREVGLEIVNRYYAQHRPSGEAKGCRAYADFREMLAREADLDAVYIMTPEHLHATIALQAMRQGKHVIMHKPLSNVLAEARLVRETAAETGVATHMFCAADKATTPQIEEWLTAGAIGPLREVHNWSSRPFWPQGMTALPVDARPVPDGLDWDLWLGPVPGRPYHPAYTHAVFRGWCDFGTGALGDMGHYSFYQLFRILKLDAPSSVEATRSEFWEIRDFQWNKQVNRVSYPRASMIHWEFPARGELPPVDLHWYDGGLRPPTPSELVADGEDLADEGMLLLGDRGKILAGFSGDAPRLIPAVRMREFQTPPETLPRPADELDQWLRACQGGGASDASFEKVYPFAETILLGTIALRVPNRLRWNSEKLEFVENADANALLRRTYREGWEL
jgi:predicted dehydrogenase